LELGPEIDRELVKARELIETQKNKDLDWSDKDAARWLKANQRFLEGADLDFEGGKGTFWTFGLEPGFTFRDMKVTHEQLYDQAVNKGVKDSQQLAKEKPDAREHRGRRPQIRLSGGYEGCGHERRGSCRNYLGDHRKIDEGHVCRSGAFTRLDEEGTETSCSVGL
jgi:hypothetical protein